MTYAVEPCGCIFYLFGRIPCYEHAKPYRSVHYSFREAEKGGP